MADININGQNAVVNDDQLDHRGGREDMATFKKEFLHHVEADPLIHWAFQPGPDRSARIQRKANSSNESLAGGRCSMQR